MGPRRQQVLVAPDAFKGSASAAAVARALGAGLRGGLPAAYQVVERPVADGGEGTVDAAVGAGFRRVPARVTGPTGEPVESAVAVRGSVAVVELADSCGLGRLPGGRLAPMTAGTYGLGQAVRAALDLGCTTVVVGVGGSASTDGGVGAARALGVRATGRDGRPVPAGAAGLAEIGQLDLRGLDARLAAVDLVFATDVDAPLLGPRGAAAVFGPQKGADAETVAVMEAGLVHLVDVLRSATGADVGDVPGLGAGGGAPAVLTAVCGARVTSGAAYVLELLGVPELVAASAWVVTGEGRWDATTWAGKGPAAVTALAHDAGVPVAAVAGELAVAGEDLRAHGVSAWVGLLDLEPDPARARAAVRELLAQAGGRLAERIVTLDEGRT